MEKVLNVIKLIVEKTSCRDNSVEYNKIMESITYRRVTFVKSIWISHRLSHGNFMKCEKLRDWALRSRFIFHWIHVACIPKIRPPVKRTVKAIASRLYVSRKSVSPDADYLDYQERVQRWRPFFSFFRREGDFLRAGFATKRPRFRH